jgi:hypothetical protein
MNDLTLSPRLANPQALVGVVHAPGGSSGAGAGRVEDCPEFTSPPPTGWGGWNETTVTKHTVGGRSYSEIVRSMTARNGHRLGETDPSTRELCRCKLCSLRSYQLLQK